MSAIGWHLTAKIRLAVFVELALQLLTIRHFPAGATIMPIVTCCKKLTGSQYINMEKHFATKKQAIESREAQLLEIASGILLDEGFHALSMERLAQELKTAKGTIYNHYPNREEIVLAIAVQAIKKRHDLFDAASLAQRPSRQRIMAVMVACEIYVTHYRRFFHVENLVRHAAIWDRCSDTRRALLQNQEQRCMSLVSGIVRNAIAANDLKLRDGVSPEEMTLSLWALIYGSYLINDTSPSLEELGVKSVHRSVRTGVMRILDGYQWQPILGDVRDSNLLEDICKEVFPEEPTIESFQQLP